MATVQSRFDPIEHMCELDRRVRKRRNPPTPLPTSATLAQLRNALIDEWNNIPMRTVNALVNSIQRRIRAATAARGGHTRYWFSVWFWFQDLRGSYQWTSITRDLLITNQWNLELFQRTILHVHTTIFIFTDILKKVQATTYVKLRSLDFQTPVRRKGKEKFKFLMEQYLDWTLSKWLSTDPVRKRTYEML